MTLSCRTFMSSAVMAWAPWVMVGHGVLGLLVLHMKAPSCLRSMPAPRIASLKVWKRVAMVVDSMSMA